MDSSQPHTNWQGVALVMTGAFCFSLAIPFTRWTDGLDTLSIAFFRALFGFLFLGLFLPRHPEPLRIGAYRRAIPLLIGLGGAVSVTVMLYTYAIRQTTAANAALLVNSAPIYVAALAPWLLKEARPRYAWLSLGLALAGIVCVSDPAQLEIGSRSWNGIAAGVLSGFTYAFVLVIGRALRGRVTGLTPTLWSLGITALVLLPWALRAPGGVVTGNLHLLIPLGVFSLGLSYLTYFMGLQRTSAQVVSVVALFEPVSGVLIGLMFFQEIPNALGVLGGALILISMVLIAR